MAIQETNGELNDAKNWKTTNGKNSTVLPSTSVKIYKGVGIMMEAITNIINSLNAKVAII